MLICSFCIKKISDPANSEFFAENLRVRLQTAVNSLASAETMYHHSLTLPETTHADRVKKHKLLIACRTCIASAQNEVERLRSLQR